MAWENQRRPKVCVCIPHTTHVTLEWVDRTYIPLKTLDNRFDKTWQLARGIPVDLAREKMVKAALTMPDITHIYFQDTDLVPEQPLNPNDAIATLLQLDQPIISGLYRAKQAANPNQAGGDPAAKMGFNYAIWQRSNEGFQPVIPPAPPTNLFTVDVTGLGCTLIKREVFERTPRPWFPWEDGGASEDFSFYMKAKAVDPKYLCWIFSGITFSHIGDLKVKTNGSFSMLEV